MLTNLWSITLLLCSFVVIFLFLRASYTGIKVLKDWTVGADTNKQIALEGETWLSASLIESGLVIQVVTLFLFVMAADDFSNVLSGAMCATGSLLANDYGFPTVFVKVLSVFLYGFWIVLHRFDIAAETFPFTRLKYYFLLFLLPVIFIDTGLQTLYLLNLNPDIITSCCGVVLGDNVEKTLPILHELSATSLLLVYCCFGSFICLLFYSLYRQIKNDGRLITFFQLLLCFCLILFFPFSLFIITMVISSFIYAMPYHHCPFDILKGDYFFIGYPIYITLFGAVFAGLSGGLVRIFFQPVVSISAYSKVYQQRASQAGLLLLLAYFILCCIYPIKYILFGE